MLIFDDDLFDYWVLQRRLPLAKDPPRPNRGPRIGELPDPYLVEKIDNKWKIALANKVAASLHPCGTHAKYQYHRKHAESIDDACREARNAHDRKWRLDKKLADVIE